MAGVIKAVLCMQHGMIPAGDQHPQPQSEDRLGEGAGLRAHGADALAEPGERASASGGSERLRHRRPEHARRRGRVDENRRGNSVAPAARQMPGRRTRTLDAARRGGDRAWAASFPAPARVRILGPVGLRSRCQVARPARSLADRPGPSPRPAAALSQSRDPRRLHHRLPLRLAGPQDPAQADRAGRPAAIHAHGAGRPGVARRGLRQEAVRSHAGPAWWWAPSSAAISPSSCRWPCGCPTWARFCARLLGRCGIAARPCGPDRSQVRRGPAPPLAGLGRRVGQFQHQRPGLADQQDLGSDGRGGGHRLRRELRPGRAGAVRRSAAWPAIAT